MADPRVLVWDLETSHNILAKFDLRDEWVPHTNILQERYVICAAWSWLGDTRVRAVSVLDDPKRFRANPNDDGHVIRTLHAVLSDADVLVAHNGDRFDVRWLNGRILAHGLSPLPPIATIDTLKIARRYFALNSNRLDYLGDYLGVGRKITTPPGLWLEALRGNAKAIRTMVTYCKGDITLLKDVFVKLRPFAPARVTRPLTAGSACPRCSHPVAHRRGFVYTRTRRYQRWQCRACGGWWTMTKPEPRDEAA